MEIDYGPPVQWMKGKYSRHHTRIRRGAPIGNGDSGKHTRHKVTTKGRALLPPQPPAPVMVVDALTGKRRWVRP